MAIEWKPRSPWAQDSTCGRFTIRTSRYNADAVLTDWDNEIHSTFVNAAAAQRYAEELEHSK